MQDFYLREFKRLSSDRQVGMGMGPIPFSNLRARAEDLGMDRSAFELFEHVIDRMDEAFRKWHEAESKKSAKAGDRGPLKGGSRKTRERKR